MTTEDRSDATPDANKRVARRMRTLKSAKIIHLNRWSVTDCAVRDLSATGAKIVAQDQMSVPNEFRLLMLMDNTICNCEVVWRKGELLGVRFTSPFVAAPPRKF
jgi:hypothetical protein